MVTARESHYVEPLARGLSVITAFGPETPEPSLSDVAPATGLTRAAARRFLLTLVDLERFTEHTVGAVVAAVNVFSHASRVTGEQARAELMPALLRAVPEIETDLSRTQEGDPCAPVS